MKVAVLCQSAALLTRARRIIKRDPDCLFLASGQLVESTLDAGVDVAGMTLKTTWMRASDGSGTRTEKTLKGWRSILSIGDDFFNLRVHHLMAKNADCLVGVDSSVSDETILAQFIALEQGTATSSVYNDRPVAFQRLYDHSLGRIVASHVGGFKSVTSAVSRLVLDLAEQSTTQTRWFLDGMVDEKSIGSVEFATSDDANAAFTKLKKGPIRVSVTDENVELPPPALLDFQGVVGACADKFSVLYIDRILRSLIEQGLVGVGCGLLPEAVSLTARAFIADAIGIIPAVKPVETKMATAYYVHDVGIKPSQVDLNVDRRHIYQLLWNSTVAAHADPSTFVQSKATYSVFGGAKILDIVRIVDHVDNDKADWFSITGGSLLTLQKRLDGSVIPTWKVREVQVGSTLNLQPHLIASFVRAEEDGLVKNETGRPELTENGRILSLLVKTIEAYDKDSQKSLDLDVALSACASWVEAGTPASAAPALHGKCSCGKSAPKFELSKTTGIVERRCRSCKKSSRLSVKNGAFSVEEQS